MNACLPLMKNVFIPQAKRVYVPLGLTEAASATDAAIQNIFGSRDRKTYGSGTTTLLISNKELVHIMKIVWRFRNSVKRC